MSISINGAIVDKVTKVLELLNIPWPGGDPKTLHELSHLWTTFGQELRSTAQQLDSRVHATVGSAWTGDAANAFQTHWKQQYDAFEHSAGNFDEVAKELSAYAQEADAIVKEIVEIALEIAEMELAGALLTFVTAGLSDLVSAAASGARALKIVSLVEKFTAMAKKAEEAISKLGEAAEKLLKIVKVLAKMLGDAIKNTAMNYIGTATNKLATGDPTKGYGLSWQDLEDAAVSGTVAAVPGAAGRFAGMAGKGREGGAATFLTGAGRWLSGDDLSGKASTVQSVLSGMVGSAAGSAVAEAQDPTASGVNPWDVLTSGVTGAGGAFAGGHYPLPQGRHAKLPPGWEVGANGVVYGGGSNLEGSTVTNPNFPGVPKAGPALTDEHGAVEVPQ